MYLPRKRSAADATAAADAAAADSWDGVLSVPFAQKDAAKALGARWDAARRTWAVPPALRARRPEFRLWDAQKPAPLPAPLVASEELQLKRASITRELVRAVSVAGAARR